MKHLMPSCSICGRKLRKNEKRPIQETDLFTKEVFWYCDDCQSLARRELL